MPNVSIIIPTHNRASALGTAIRSVLSQTEQDFEVLVVDDASTDSTEQVVTGFGDARIRYLRQPTKRGVAAARNAGIESSTAPYIAFLDDDDEWLFEKLAFQLALVRKYAGVGLIYGAQETVEAATGRSAIIRLAGDPEAQLRWCRITTSTVMVARTAVDKVGLFDEQLVCGSDYDLWIRLWRAGVEFRGIDRMLARYAIHDKGLTANVPEKIAAQERILQKHASFLAEDRPSFSEQYRILGLLCLTAGEGLKGRKALARSVRLRPTLRTAAYYAISLFGAGALPRVQGLLHAIRNSGQPAGSHPVSK
jgi:glycosyltransferase involved in cell wall biosynthesis